MSKKVALTHGGQFHADDVFSSVVLETLGWVIQRCADKDLASAIAEIVEEDPQSEVLVFDIGRKFDGIQYFDHHQPDGPQRTNGKKFSSFGLLWYRFGREYIRSFSEGGETDEGCIEKTWARLNDSFVAEIDALDNGEWEGGQPPAGHIARIISGMNICLNVEGMFTCACATGTLLLDQIVTSAYLTEQEKAHLRAEIEVWKNNPIIVLEKGAPGLMETVFEVGATSKFVVFHDELRGDWKLQCIPPSLDQWTSQRLPLPESWLTTPPLGCTFVHAGRWIAAFDSKIHALAAAEFDIIAKEF